MGTKDRDEGEKMVKKRRKEEINEGARTRHMRPEMRKQKKKTRTQSEDRGEDYREGLR